MSQAHFLSAQCRERLYAHLFVHSLSAIAAPHQRRRTLYDSNGDVCVCMYQFFTSVNQCSRWGEGREEYLLFAVLLKVESDR